MRIVALGGAGYQGTVAVRDQVASGVSEVVIADYNIERAKELAAKLSTKKSKVSAQFVDVNDYRSLVEVMKGADVVTDTIGPFEKYGTKKIEAAIEARVNLIDIDDDWEVTRDSIDLSEQAKKAGITVIIGLGASPGLSNVLAKYGADKLDRVDEILMAWAAGWFEPIGRSAFPHAFREIIGMVPTFRNGKLVDIPAGSGEEIVELPEPVGKVTVHHVAHGEPVSIPRYIKGVKTVSLKGGFVPLWPFKFLISLHDFGFDSTEPLMIKGTPITPMDFTAQIMGNSERYTPEIRDRISKESKPAIGLRVEVRGEKAGKATRSIYQFVGRTHHCTGLPMSIAAQMVARGDIKAKGVFAPEGCPDLDPKTFLAEVSKRGIEFKEMEERTL